MTQRSVRGWGASEGDAGVAPWLVLSTLTLVLWTGDIINSKVHSLQGDGRGFHCIRFCNLHMFAFANVEN